MTITADQIVRATFQSALENPIIIGVVLDHLQMSLRGNHFAVSFQDSLDSSNVRLGNMAFLSKEPAPQNIHHLVYDWLGNEQNDIAPAPGLKDLVWIA